MKRHSPLSLNAAALLLLTIALPLQADEDELPPGLDQAIKNPAIPMIVDATITKFTKEGYAQIKVNKVYKAPKPVAGKKAALPILVKGYSSAGVNPRVVPIRIITDRGKTRFLFFLDGDLLYSTYNNRFEIREDKKKKLTVNTGRGWKPLKEMVALIPAAKPKQKK